MRNIIASRELWRAEGSNGAGRDEDVDVGLEIHNLFFSNAVLRKYSCI